MDSIEQEINVIKEIYGDTFELEKRRVWQAASTPPAFSIIITPDNDDVQDVSVKLYVKYSNTYPRAPAIFTLQQPQGLSPAQVTTLTKLVRERSLELVGEVMVFEIRMLISDWIATNNSVAKRSANKPGPSVSLATEMTERAKQLEEAQQLRANQEADSIRQREEQHASYLAQRIEEDIHRREEKVRAEKERRKSRLESTDEDGEEDLRSQNITFEGGVDVGANVLFEVFKLFSPRQDGFGTTYVAEPATDDFHECPPLELHAIVFDADYYMTTQGKKKLRDLEKEIRVLCGVRHRNLARVYAASLDIKASESPRLSILMDRLPPLSLRELLQNCDNLKAPKALDYMKQITSALEVLHLHDLVHRGITPANILISKAVGASEVAHIVVARACYHQRIVDLHKSNAFGPKTSGEIRAPDSWCSFEMLESPHQYNHKRDIWSLGIVFIQMLIGLDVLTWYDHAVAALDAVDLPILLKDAIRSMFDSPKRKGINCTKLIERFSSITLDTIMKSASNPIISDLGTPMGPSHFGSSPEVGYFAAPPRAAPPPRTSRYREDWEELEFLGKGGFGSVVKAKNKLDGRIYAVKKIKLRRENDGKILREVNALSRLSHAFIVRYYTTWLETTIAGTETPSETDSSDITGDDEDESQYGRRFNDPDLDDDQLFHIDDLSLRSPFSTSNSFPSIHFGDDSDSHSYREEGGTSSDSTPGQSPVTTRGIPVRAPRVAPQVLYIQMEFVERQTLKEAIEEGLSEDEAWRLFRQILEALAHISSLGIVHRDIKLTNIFIDAKRDVKVGDFGLATSSLAAVDPSDVSDGHTTDVELTTGVGTGLYIAPEVSSRGGSRNHNKADMYSLGIVFFEMNWPPFDTDTERYHVLQALRLPSITFPSNWENRPRQHEIILQLLQHDPDLRPSAHELTKSKLLPERMEEENIKEALRLMVDPTSPRYEALLRSLFNQPIDPAKDFSYDIFADQSQERAPLNGIVRDHVVSLFRLHGAIDVDPPLFVPVSDLYPADHSQPPTFLDRQGELITLPKTIIIPLARSAARANLERIKRFHIGHTFEPQATGGQPKAWLQAAFDIISPDVASMAAEAEVISVVNECIDLFPGISKEPWNIHITNSKAMEIMMSHLPKNLREDVMAILEQSKSSFPQKRSSLSKIGLSRMIIDELEVLLETDDIDGILPRLQRIGRVNPLLSDAIKDIQQTVRYATLMGVRRRFYFRPMIMANQPQYGNGIMFEFRGTKRTDVIARGGRYDHLITRYAQPSTKRTPVKAIGVQIALERIRLALASHQRQSVDTLIKDERTFGLWSPRRCDVYIIGFRPGQLEARMELAAHLWQHGISADLMYESAIDSGHEGHVTAGLRQGILFLIWLRPKSLRHDQTVYKVKSVLKGTENEVRPQDLVGWLTHQLAEQKRIDASSSSANGTGITEYNLASVVPPKESSTAVGSSIQVVLPPDREGRKQQRHKTKLQYHEKAFAMESELKSAMQGNGTGFPMIAVDAPSAALAALTVNSAWLTNDEAWRGILTEFPALYTSGALLRGAVLKKRENGSKFVYLFSVKDDRVFLFKM